MKAKSFLPMALNSTLHGERPICLITVKQAQERQAVQKLQVFLMKIQKSPSMETMIRL